MTMMAGKPLATFMTSPCCGFAQLSNVESRLWRRYRTGKRRLPS
jgi:hypothetical protein